MRAAMKSLAMKGSADVRNKKKLQITKPRRLFSPWAAFQSQATPWRLCPRPRRLAPLRVSERSIGRQNYKLLRRRPCVLCLLTSNFIGIGMVVANENFTVCAAIRDLAVVDREQLTAADRSFYTGRVMTL